MQENKHFCTSYVTNFSDDLNGIGFAAEAFWSAESYTLYILHLINIQGKEPNLGDFMNKI